MTNIEKWVENTCKICKETKPIDMFYASKSHLKGVDNRCKQCHCERSRIVKNRNYNPELARARKLKRQKLVKRITKLQEVELKRELEDKVMEMVAKYEQKNKIWVDYNFTVERIKRVEITKKK